MGSVSLPKNSMGELKADLAAPGEPHEIMRVQHQLNHSGFLTPRNEELITVLFQVTKLWSNLLRNNR